MLPYSSIFTPRMGGARAACPCGTGKRRYGIGIDAIGMEAIMLQAIAPAEVISALKSLLVNTPRLPKTEQTPKKILQAADIRTYLDDVQARAFWFQCPDCEQEWNALTPDGICISCVDKKHAAELKQRELGI